MDTFYYFLSKKYRKCPALDSGTGGQGPINDDDDFESIVCLFVVITPLLLFLLFVCLLLLVYCSTKKSTTLRHELLLFTASLLDGGVTKISDDGLNPLFVYLLSSQLVCCFVCLFVCLSVCLLLVVYCSTKKSTSLGREFTLFTASLLCYQSWALSVFLNIFNTKK